MPQASILLANTSRSAYRAAHNEANAAIASHQAGDTPPPNPAAGWIWYDTANDIFRRRNQSNTAWIDLTPGAAVLDEDDFVSDSENEPPSQQSTAAYIAAQLDGFAAGAPDFPRLSVAANEVLGPGSFVAFSDPASMSVGAGSANRAEIFAHTFAQPGEATFQARLTSSGNLYFMRNGVQLGSSSSSNSIRSMDITFGIGDMVSIEAQGAIATTTANLRRILTDDQAVLPGYNQRGWFQP